MVGDIYPGLSFLSALVHYARIQDGQKRRRLIEERPGRYREWSQAITKDRALKRVMEVWATTAAR